MGSSERPAMRVSSDYPSEGVTAAFHAAAAPRHYAYSLDSAREKRTMTPAQRVAAVMAAAALAVPVIATFEGYAPVGYRDPAPGAFETICYGHMQKGVLGKRYTPDQCAELLASDAVTHGLGIAKCLPDSLPMKTRAAFTSFGFNVGQGAFCASTLARKANAGDLRGACAELSKWTYAGNRQLPGLVRRRAAEKAMCLEGLA